MNFRIEVICVGDDGTEQPREIMTVAKEQVTMETLGLTLAEGKELLAAVQTYVVAQQAAAYLEHQRPCATCGKPHCSKEPRRSTVNTVFGPVAVPNPRWHRCICQKTGPQTFRPTAHSGSPARRAQSCCIWRPNGTRLSPAPRWSTY
ncbi:MAG: hypothetical protein HYZ72_11880 [Deltaproteobacteria bacterium]|nr:hypothetical protein [Deltaproteobacteria bacterium]